MHTALIRLAEYACLSVIHMFVAEGFCGGCVSVGGVCGGDGSSRRRSGLAVAVLVIIIVILLLVVMIVLRLVAECECLLQSALLQHVYPYEVQIIKLCFAIKVAYKLPTCAPSILPKFHEVIT